MPDTTLSATAPAQAAVQDSPRRTDKQIWGIYIMLCIISIVELYSASSHEVTASNIFGPILRHVMFLLVGLGIMLGLQRTHYKYFLRWIWPFAIASAVLMLVTLFFGDYINGARRSISLGPIAIQPAEMVKISVVLVIALVLSRSQMKGETDVTNEGLIKVCLTCAAAAILLVSQGLTNTLLLMGIAMSMMLIGGISAKKFFIIVGVVLVLGGSYVAYKALKPSIDDDKKVENVKVAIEGTDVMMEVGGAAGGNGRGDTWRKRIERYFNKEKYNEPINDLNQQEQYSYIAQAHGGVFGVMPGNSRETARLPLAFSDYIYAIIIEELGLVGGICVLILYLWLLARADVWPIAARRPSGAAGNGYGSVYHVPGCVPYVYRHGRVPGVGAAVAVDIERRHVDTNHIDGPWYHAECEPLRSTQRQESRD